MQWQSATLWNILEKHQECGRNGRGKRSYIHITDTSAQSSIFTSFYIRRRIGLVLQEKRVFLIHLRVARICSLISLTLLLSRSFLPPFVSPSSSFRFLPLSQILLNCSRVEPQISVSLSLFQTKLELYGICVTSAQSTHSPNNTYIHFMPNSSSSSAWINEKLSSSSYCTVLMLVMKHVCVYKRTRMAIASIMTTMALITYKLLTALVRMYLHRVVSGLFVVFDYVLFHSVNKSEKINFVFICI